MFVRDVLEALNSEKAEYALIGGMALALHGIVRATMDVDLIVRVRKRDLERVESALNGIGLESRIPLRASEVAEFRDEYVEKRNLLAWSFVDWNDPSRVVDIVILHDLADFKIARVKWGGLSVPTLSLEDLLKTKEGTGRAQDKADCEKILEKIQERRPQKNKPRTKR